MLRGLFIESGRSINSETTKQLVEIEEKDPLLTGKIHTRDGEGAGEDGKKVTGLLYKILYNNDTVQRSRKFEINFGFKKRLLKNLNDEICLIGRYISKRIPPPSTIVAHRWENICMVIRATLMRDDWYENRTKGADGKTSNRGPYMDVMPVLFVLQLHYRLWRRMDLVFNPPTEDRPSGPVWENRRYFIGGGFPVLEDDDQLSPINEWSPAKIYRAMNTLYHARLIHTARVDTMESAEIFVAYRDALFDQLTLQILFLVPGAPEELSVMNGTRWFRLATDVIKKTKEGGGGKEAGEGLDQAYYALSKEINHHQHEETARKRQKLALLSTDGEEGGKKEGIVVSKDERYRLMKKVDDERSIVRKKAELAKMKIYLKALRSGGVEDENEDSLQQRMENATLQERTEDEEEADKIEKQIKELEETLRIAKEIERREKMRENAQRLEQSIEASTIIATTLQQWSAAQPLFAKEMMLLHDHLSYWQFVIGERSQSFTPRFSAIRKALRDHISDMLRKTSEKKILNSCHSWIVSRDVDFHEREAYRQARSDAAIFNSIDVLTYVRGTSEVDEDGNFESPAVIKGFPNDITQLLFNSENRFSEKAWNFFVWWYMLQLMPGINIDSCVFMFDLEINFLSIQRKPELQSPVMGKVGYEWIVMSTGEWEREDGLLNGKWCGSHALDAFTCWVMEMEKCNWRIIDRMSDKIICLKGTILSDLIARIGGGGGGG
jgi:hypothetical protein